MRRAPKTPFAALAVLLVAVCLAACGEDSTTTEAGGRSPSAGDSTREAAKGGTEGKPGKGPAAGQSGGSSSGSASDFTPRKHDDSGGGSQQLRVKGGDNSVQEFGEEADTAEFEAAAAALHNFLDARAESNWAAACEYIAKPVIESFEELATEQPEENDCAAVLERLTNPAAKPLMKAEAAKADVGSLRVEGEQAFVIYTGIEGTILAMPMEEEEGSWKVGSLAGTPLN